MKQLGFCLVLHSVPRSVNVQMPRHAAHCVRVLFYLFVCNSLLLFHNQRHVTGRAKCWFWAEDSHETGIVMVSLKYPCLSLWKTVVSLCDFIRVCGPSDEESVLMLWNSMLPNEVKDLKKHCEKRERIAAKMREQLYHA